MPPVSRTFSLLILTTNLFLVHCLPQRQTSSSSGVSTEAIGHRIVNRITESSRIIFDTESYVKLITTTAPNPRRPSQSQSLGKCEKHCVPLDICPSLFALLQVPTDKHIQTLKKSACGFTTEKEPMVWCEDAVCLDRVLNDRRITLELSGDKISETPIPTSTESHVIATGNLLDQDGCGETIVSDRISGGKFASRGEFPWMVSIVQDKNKGESSAYCTGSLIAEDWILTAAHCVADEDGKIMRISHVRIGAWNISNEQELGALDIRVQKYFPHPNYEQKPRIRNDIALLKLVEKVALNSVIGVICLPNAQEALPIPGSLASVAGWGSDGSSDFSPLLRKTTVKFVDPDPCVDMFQIFGGSVDPSTQICAQGDRSDSCRGDSGGPLMVSKRGKIFTIGVVSYGSTICDGGFPAVYSKVSEYMHWIQGIMLENK